MADGKGCSAMSRLDSDKDGSGAHRHKSNLMMNHCQMIWKFLQHSRSDAMKFTFCHRLVVAVVDAGDSPSIFRVANHSVKSQVSAMFA